MFSRHTRKRRRWTKLKENLGGTDIFEKEKFLKERSENRLRLTVKMEPAFPSQILQANPQNEKQKVPNKR